MKGSQSRRGTQNSQERRKQNHLPELRVDRSFWSESSHCRTVVRIHQYRGRLIKAGKHHVAQPSEIRFGPRLVCMPHFIYPQSQPDVFSIGKPRSGLAKHLLCDLKNGFGVGFDSEIYSGGEVHAPERCSCVLLQKVSRGRFRHARCSFTEPALTCRRYLLTQAGRSNTPWNLPSKKIAFVRTVSVICKFFGMLKVGEPVTRWEAVRGAALGQ